MRVNYSVKGEGPTIILLHGWGGSSKSLERLQEYLADMGFQVFDFDLPGFGKSSMPSDSMTLSDYVEYLKEFISRLNIYKPILVGHSFGGKLAMAFAIEYGAILAKLVLIDASGIYPRNKGKRTVMYFLAKTLGLPFKLPPLKFLQPLARKLFYRVVVQEQDYLKSDRIKSTFQNIISEHLDDKLDRIQNETLIIWGEKDIVTPLWQGEKIAKSIAGSRFEVVQDAKHSLPLEQPEVVSKIIYSYLNP